MQCDLHGFTLEEAIDEILHVLHDCSLYEDCNLEIIHGHHHGQRIKNYLRSPGFLKQMARFGFHLKRKGSPDEGISNFELLKTTSK